MPPFTRVTRAFRRPYHLTSVYERVLGTELEVQIIADSARLARQAEATGLREIERLTRVFNRFDPSSELQRLQSRPGEAALLSEDLAFVLREAERWHLASAGAFHPGADALGAVWKRAEQLGTPPDPIVLAQIVSELRKPLWAFADHSRATYLSTLPMGLNALAKGHVVDCVARSMYGCPGVTSLLVNAGGDLRAIGESGVNVAVADPRSESDNLPPLITLHVRNAALASSGGARRGFRIGEVWHSHLIDPRTGFPVTEIPGVTVVAPSCLEADALATCLSVLEAEQGLALVDATAGAAALIVSRRGQQHASQRWDP